MHPDPFNPANNGRVARPGQGGSSTGFGAISHSLPAVGGARGLSVFVDANPTNDFWGRRFNPFTGLLEVGELAAPRGGSGGGAGGNSINAASIPNPSWNPGSDKKGSGGAGGGGLLLLNAQVLRVGPSGLITANGGRGGTGEHYLGLDPVGGSSGGGSGGMLVLQARRVDLSQASNACLSALGGDGGRGAGYTFNGDCAGGDGGPGLIQLHVANGLSDIQLPAGKTLADMSVPEAYVLLPELNF